MNRLDMMCRQAEQFCQSLKTAPPPENPHNLLPVAGGDVTDKHIMTIAQRGQHGRKYLTKPQRIDLFNRLRALDIPGKNTLVLRDLSDVWLCRLLFNGWSVQFVKQATGMWPKAPVLLKRKYT